MTEEDERFFRALREAVGANDNAEWSPDAASTIFINGSVGALYVGDGQKNRIVIVGGMTAPVPSRRVPLDRQNFTPRHVVRALLDGLPPPAGPARQVADRALGSGPFSVGFREAMGGALRTS